MNSGVLRVNFQLILRQEIFWYAIKMPGSLSNEDEVQEDMDFEDEIPGERMK